MPSMTTTRYLRLTAVLVTVLVLSGCGVVARFTGQPGPAVATSTVRVVDNGFDPADTEIAAGDTLTWTWQGDNDHNVVGDGFSSPVQRDGTFQHRFTTPGTYPYRCTLHGWMRGTVTVVSPDGAEA